MATINYGPDCIATDVQCDASIRGVQLALARILTRAEYRRVYRGCSEKRTSVHIRGNGDAWIAFVATRNDDGSHGPTYILTES